MKKNSDIQKKIWKVIRGLNTFAFDDVKTLTEDTSPGVTKYLLKLFQAGYVKPAGKRDEGTGRKKAIWRITKNTGPHAPRFIHCLHDTNINSVTELNGIGYWETPGSTMRGRKVKHVH